ncbi:cytochrome c, mono- and diheme variants [alpha proteobacterium Q-1]|nr:cytochrome c, mono- and diheme variants [alpha proteobacterium Q-1]
MFGLPIRLSRLRFPKIRFHFFVLALVFSGVTASGVHAQGPASAPKGDPALGKRLYYDGISADGSVISGITGGDIQISGAQMTCVSCHRPSGMGSSEGGVYVPPINASYLFTERKADRALRNERFKEYYKEPQGPLFVHDARRGRLRPAYELDHLGAAIREGVDPVGRALNPAMPRYELSDTDVANLYAFLKETYPSYDKGVEPEKLHLATIVAGPVDPERAEAFTGVITAYADWKSKSYHTDKARPGYSPYYRSEFQDSYRDWDIAVWRLTGDPKSWPEQLERYYQKQPAFLVASALVEGDYAPIAAFCDAKRMPCILPITQLPSENTGPDSFTIYFSRALLLEADALADHLGQNLENAPEKGTIRQIYHQDAEGRKPAERFASAMEKRAPEQKIKSQKVKSGKAPEKSLEKAWRKAIKAAVAGKNPSSTLILWPGTAPEAAAKALAETSLPGDLMIYVPSASIAAMQAQLPEGQWGHVRAIYPYDKPDAYHADAYRIRAWLRARKLPIPDWTMQLQAYYAVKTISFAMGHLLSDYYGSYLIELIEHDIGVGFDPGPHPRLSLGSGQRFGSKGAYIVKFDATNRKGVEPVSDWIVP